MLPSFCNQSITRLRPGIKIVRDQEIPDWSPSKVNELTITGCSIQPASTGLSEDGRVLGISEGLTAYLPEGSDVQEGDRIVFEGDTYTISGVPKKWAAPFTRSSVQLNLTRWSG